MKLSCRAIVTALITGILGFSPSSFAAEAASPWVETEQSRIRLISEYDGLKDLGAVRIGLQVQLEPGWKIYWRTPGDAGIPPQFDWTGSVNFKQSEVHWPVPEQFDVFGLSTWGYHDEVVYPITVTLKESGEPLDLKLKLFFGICEQVCIPYQHELALSLNNVSAVKSSQAELIEEFAKMVPKEIGSAATDISLVAAAILDDIHFSVTAQTNQQFSTPDIIVEGDEGAFFSVSSRKISEDGKTAVFEVTADLPGKTDTLKGQNIVVTVFDETTAAEGPLVIGE